MSDKMRRQFLISFCCPRFHDKQYALGVREVLAWCTEVERLVHSVLSLIVMERIYVDPATEVQIIRYVVLDVQSIDCRVADAQLAKRQHQ